MKLFGNKRHARHVSGKGLRGWHKGTIMICVSVLILAGAVYALIDSLRDAIKPPEIEHPTMSDTEGFVPPTVVEVETHVNEETGEEITVEVERPASHKEDFYNILVVGTDDEGSRTDTIMIARMDVKDHTVALLSIPRDTVIAGNYNVPKINGVYGSNGKGEKGMQALKSKLAQLLGFEVDGYALVNLDAFIELVDLVGGVEFEVPMDMHYDDPTQDLYIHLNKGWQHLDGQKAMQLVRFRKGYATQDIQRTKTQQLFLQALAQKCLEEVSITNIGAMAEIFMENVVTDLTLGNIAFFGQELLECDFENMFSYTLEGEAVMIRKASCYAIYRNKTLDVVNEYFNPYDAPITSANVTIRTPDEVRAEEAARRAAEEPEEEISEEEGEVTEEEEELPEDPMDEDMPEDPFAEEELTQEPEDTEEVPSEEIPEEEEAPETELPTDDWVEEEPEEDFWRP